MGCEIAGNVAMLELKNLMLERNGRFPCQDG